MIIIKAIDIYFQNVSGNIFPICSLLEIPQFHKHLFCVHIIENTRENTLSEFPLLLSH